MLPVVLNEKHTDISLKETRTKLKGFKFLKQWKESFRLKRIDCDRDIWSIKYVGMKVKKCCK